MSVIIVVQQYMNAGGIARLPKIFREHRALAAGFKGFVSLRLMTPLDEREEGQISLIVEFSSEKTLMKWRNSPEHARVAELYQAYRTKPPTPVFYRVEE